MLQGVQELFEFREMGRANEEEELIHKFLFVG
jgi:hypothetical protein